MQKSKDGRSLRERIRSEKEIVVLPGVYDALSARIAEQVGFNAMFQTGYGSSAALLGMPDFGFLNATETVENADRIIRAVSVPVLVDVDTGYGSPLNVWKLVRDLERLGASGIFLEDQVWPKRCGHMQGKDVIPKEQFLLKLRAALEARGSKDFIIVARTDARAPLGIDEAIDRGNAYRMAGADVVFVEAPRNVQEMKKIANEINAPLVANIIEDGLTPTLNAEELQKLGYKIAVFPLSALYSATFAVREVLVELKRSGTTNRMNKTMVKFKEFNKLVDIQRYMRLEKRYAL